MKLERLSQGYINARFVLDSFCTIRIAVFEGSDADLFSMSFLAAMTVMVARMVLLGVVQAQDPFCSHSLPWEECQKHLGIHLSHRVDSQRQQSLETIIVWKQ